MLDKNLPAISLPAVVRTSKNVSAIGSGQLHSIELAVRQLRELYAEAVRILKLLEPSYWFWQEQKLKMVFRIPPECRPFSNPKLRATRIFHRVHAVVSKRYFWTIMDIKEAWVAGDALTVVFRVREPGPLGRPYEGYFSRQDDVLPSTPLMYFFKS